MIQVIFYTDNYPDGIAVEANEDYVSNKFTRYHGKVSANSVDFSVDNSDNTFVWDYVDKKLTVRFIDSLGDEQFENLEQYTKVQIKINNELDFTGYIDYPNESYDENTLEFTAKDFWFRCENTKVDKQPYISYPADPLYFNDLFEEYLLKANYEGTFDNVYDINQEIDYFMVEEDSTVADVLNRLVESVGGEVYFNNEGNIVFDGGCFAAQDVTPPSSGQYVITENDISNLSIKRNALKNNVFEVKATPPRKNLDDDGNMILDYVYVGADPDKPIKIGTDTETEFQIEFDENKVFYVVGYQNTQKYWWEFWKKDSEVFKFEATGGITLDQATYNSNFFYNIPGDEYGGGYIKNPSVFDIKLNGADVTDPPEEVTLFAFMGCFLKEDTFIAVVGEPDAGDYERKMELENNVIQTKAWAELLASYLKQVDNNKMTLSFELVNEAIGKDVKVGDYVTINVSNPQLQKVDGLFKVETIAYDYAKGIYECEVNLVYSQLTPETANIKTRNDFNFNVPNGFLLQMREEFPFIENRITLTENQLDEIANDNKLTPSEKKTVRTEWQRIQNEYASITNQAAAYELSYSNYTTQYNALDVYITGLNLTSDTTETIDRATFISKFENYYVEKEAIVNKIQNRIHDEGTKDFVGATDPSTLYTLANGVIWHDTGANELKQWNATTSSWVVLRTNYDIGKIKVEGDNLYAGEIKSNALLSDGTTPVSKISLDDGTFKFGDDVSANPKYIKYDSNGDLIIKGGTLEATNALLWTDIDITVTVGANGDFPNISQALEYLSKFWITHRSNNLTINGYVKILSGHTVNDYLRFENEDLGWITIISEDEDVPLEAADWEPFIRATNSRLPKIFTHFLCDGIFSDVYGIITLDNSSIQIGGSAFINKFGFSKVGTSNSQDRFRIIRNSNVISHEATYANIEKIYIKNSHWSSWLDNFQNTGYGFSIESASTCDLNFCDFTGASLHNIEAYDMSIINAYKCTFEPSLNPNVEVHNGSQVNITGSTDANPSEPLNTLTPRGIIFKE
jgi:hypothetical protein